MAKKPSQIFEAHIAIPKISSKLAKKILAKLRTIGIQNHDYFLRLSNVEDKNQPCRIDPSTHDIDDPFIITSTLFTDYENAVKTILEGMAILERHGVTQGNFELEAVLDSRLSLPSQPNIAHFPGFTQQQGAPLFENHIMWFGPRSSLPSYESIIQFHKEVFGYSPNQLVDFALSSSPKKNDTVWRVSTVYQSTRDATLEFSKVVHANKDKFPGFKETVEEQICVVSEPLRD